MRRGTNKFKKDVAFSSELVDVLILKKGHFLSIGGESGYFASWSLIDMGFVNPKFMLFNGIQKGKRK